MQLIGAEMGPLGDTACRGRVCTMGTMTCGLSPSHLSGDGVWGALCCLPPVEGAGNWRNSLGTHPRTHAPTLRPLSPKTGYHFFEGGGGGVGGGGQKFSLRRLQAVGKQFAIRQPPVEW